MYLYATVHEQRSEDILQDVCPHLPPPMSQGLISCCHPWLWIALPAYPSCQDQTYNLTPLTKDLFFSLCIHVFSLHVWVIILHVLCKYVFHACAWYVESLQGFGCPGTQVIDFCELSCGLWELNQFSTITAHTLSPLSYFSSPKFYHFFKARSLWYIYWH